LFSILGVALLSTDLPPRVGWMLIISVALLFVLTLIFRDMVPLMFYLVTMVTGVMLLMRSGATDPDGSGEGRAVRSSSDHCLAGAGSTADEERQFGLDHA
jgi:hypothetical protein